MLIILQIKGLQMKKFLQWLKKWFTCSKICEPNVNSKEREKAENEIKCINGQIRRFLDR